MAALKVPWCGIMYQVSQDSFLHAGRHREMAVAEAARVLRPGGHLVFTVRGRWPAAGRGGLTQLYRGSPCRSSARRGPASLKLKT